MSTIASELKGSPFRLRGKDAEECAVKVSELLKSFASVGIDWDEGDFVHRLVMSRHSYDTEVADDRDRANYCRKMESRSTRAVTIAADFISANPLLSAGVIAMAEECRSFAQETYGYAKDGELDEGCEGDLFDEVPSCAKRLLGKEFVDCFA